MHHNNNWTEKVVVVVVSFCLDLNVMITLHVGWIRHSHDFSHSEQIYEKENKIHGDMSGGCGTNIFGVTSLFLS